jgi:dTDP-4-dehydrorhamnose reductase
MRVAVLGANGMLGWVVTRCLAEAGDFRIRATVRDRERPAAGGAAAEGVDYEVLDAERCGAADLARLLDGAAWAVNAIGVIKPYIHDDVAREVERATRVNAVFPHELARAAEATGTTVIQIATDCVFSGTRGSYAERDEHDPRDVYGKTKSLGEVYSPAVHHVRCSIIGPELKGHRSLLDWFLRQPRGAAVKGFLNHAWNGVTTLQFARVCLGLIRENPALPHVQHLVPAGVVSKAELLALLAGAFDRADVAIEPVQAATPVDRTLATLDAAANDGLWAAAGYRRPPSVGAMIAELAGWSVPA